MEIIIYAAFAIIFFCTLEYRIVYPNPRDTQDCENNLDYPATDST